MESGQEVAIKIIKHASLNDSVKLNKVKQEAKILAMFSHPHIMKVYELIETNDGIYIVMEYLPGGELYDQIISKERFSEEEARNKFQELIFALDYCHHHGVVHRDIKPENILIDDHDHIKLIDFGLANYFRDGRFLQTSCGSVNYAAPEILSGDSYSGPEVDIWSSGIVLYLLVCGVLPFDDINLTTLFAKIKTGDYKTPHFVSDECSDLIARMLDVDPISRIQINQIRGHPWFNVDIPNHLTFEINCVDYDHNFLSINDYKTKSGMKLDEEIFKKCMDNPKLLVNKADHRKLIRRLEKKKQDAFSVCYRMLSDAKRKEKMITLNKMTLDIYPVFNTATPRNSIEFKLPQMQRRSLSFYEDNSDSACLILPHNWTYGFRTKISLKETLERLFLPCQKLGLVSLMQTMKKLNKLYYRMSKQNQVKFDIRVYCVRFT